MSNTETTSDLFGISLADARFENVIGTVFKKQLVRFGDWVHPSKPGKKMVLDAKWAGKIIDNFKKKVVGRIPVPTTHTDDPLANTGELLDLEIQDDGLYGVLDIRRREVAADIKRDLVYDVSISFTDDYVDTKTGTAHGPALLHVALVNDPYLKGMNAFEALSKPVLGVVMLSEAKVIDAPSDSGDNQKSSNDLEETIVDDNTTPSETPTEETPAEETPAEDTEDKGQDDDKAPEGAEDADAASDDASAEDDGDGDEGDADLSEADLRRELSDTKAKLRRKEAEESFSKLLSEGKAVPAQKEAYLELCMKAEGSIQLSDGKSKPIAELVTELISKGTKKVSFSEDGKTGEEDAEKPSAQLSEEDQAVLNKLEVTNDDYDKFQGAPAPALDNVEK